MLRALRFDLDQRFSYSLQNATTIPIAGFTKKKSVIIFELVRAKHSFWQHCVPLVETHRMNYKLVLQSHVKKKMLKI